jgi:hypothetical protein
MFHDCPACECTGIEPVSKVDEALKEMNEALNKMNAKMLLDSMTEKPPSDERLFKPLKNEHDRDCDADGHDGGDYFEAARHGIELPKKYPGQTIQIIDDNLDNPRVEYSQIEHLLDGRVWRSWEVVK